MVIERPSRRYSRRTLSIVLAIIIVVAVGSAVSIFAFTNWSRTTCVLTAGPLALGLRVVADGNQTPIAGAHVAATNTALSCNGAPADPQKTMTYVTNGSEWHYLDIGEDASYSFIVTYSGHSYRFSTNLGVEEVTCATLFIPSGRTNVTFASFQNTCPSITTTTSESASAISSPSASATSTVTLTAGQFPPSGCALVASNSNGSLYASTDAEVGDSVCVAASLNNSSEVYLGIMNSTGGVVFSGSCVATASPGAPSPKGDTCTAYWNTASTSPQGKSIQPGVYLLVARDYEGVAAALEANFTLS
jgi:hypothetical protein